MFIRLVSNQFYSIPDSLELSTIETTNTIMEYTHITAKTPKNLAVQHGLYYYGSHMDMVHNNMNNMSRSAEPSSAPARLKNGSQFYMVLYSDHHSYAVLNLL